MADSRAAYRYALAVIGLADELKQLDKVSQDIEFLSGVLRQSREFLLFLKNPVVNKEKKKTVVSEIVQGRVSEPTFRFLRLLISKGRETIIPEIIKSFFDRTNIDRFTFHAQAIGSGFGFRNQYP